MFQTRSFGGPKRKGGKFTIEQRPIDDLMPDYILPANPSNPFGLSGRSFGMGFRNPHQAQPQGIAIAKGDARAPENSAGDADADPEMISWQRRCY